MPSDNLEADVLSFSDLPSDAEALIQKVRETKRPLIITQAGHSVAVVLGVSEYQQLLEELELLRDLHAAARQIDEGEGVPQEDAHRQALAILRA